MIKINISQSHLKDAFRHWVAFAVMITLLCGGVYVVAQQIYRQSANDPQIQIAEDVGRLLGSGVPTTQILQQGSTDISKSLATFLVVFDATGKPVVSSGMIDGKIPTLPSGVLAYAQAHSEDRITWQPSSGFRAAIVVTAYNANGSSGYVMVGRSLRETETRIHQLGINVFLVWFVTLILVFLACIGIVIFL